MNILITICVMYLFVGQLETRVIDDYIKRRNDILEEEKLLSLGGKLILTDEEEEANEILMQWKQKEMEESFHNPQNYNFSKHYFTYKKYIESSKVYQIIRKMPKGAALHVHSSFMLDAESLVELTYEDHLYACYHDNLKLRFSDTVPTLECPVKWTLLSELRDASDNITLFDKQLEKHFTLVTDDEDFMNADINTVWKQFESLHKVIKSLISYRPVNEKYFYKVLEKFYADNIMYIELRSGYGSLYELDGKIHDKLYTPKLYREITNRFVKTHPDFFGVKFILAKYRGGTPKKIQESLELAKQMKENLPDVFAGFDMVGQEDLGYPLTEFIPILKQYTNDIQFYFHAGETVWFGSPTDENLVDAILLGSKRIGHAYALLKHPSLLRRVIEKDIGLEVNVISNGVLSLVRDMRNHPLATYLALGMPVILSSDDPGAWGAEPLSHDFYVAFVGVASKNYDLRLLKQLAINSIKYSALEKSDKERCMKAFCKKWFRFIKDIRQEKFGTLEIVDLNINEDIHNGTSYE